MSTINNKFSITNSKTYFLKIPQLPNKVLCSCTAEQYVRSRIIDVLSYCKSIVKKDNEIVEIRVHCGRFLSDLLAGKLHQMDKYPISFDTDYYWICQNGTFFIDVEFVDDFKISTATGIYYDKMVSKEEYETRWTLQVVDGNHSELAYSIAEKMHQVQ